VLAARPSSGRTRWLDARHSRASALEGDLTGAVEHAGAALERAAVDDHLSIASACAVSGLASWTKGDLETAYHGYRVAADHLGRAGYVADVVGCAITLADIEMTQGRLGAAQRTFEDAVALAREPAPPRGTADMYTGLSEVAHQCGDLSGAADCLRRADDLGEDAGLPKYPYRWRVAMAQLREAQGDSGTALALLDEAQRVYVADFAPNVQPIPATRARMLAASGEVAAALAWARRVELSADDDLSYLREYEYVTLARILLSGGVGSPAADDLAQATRLLNRLLLAAETGGRAGTVTEILVLLALAQEAGGRQDHAVASLGRAIGLAEADGHVRSFTGLGGALQRRLTALLKALASGPHDSSGYAQRLLDRGDERRQQGPRPTDPGQQSLVDPLSTRELDVLRLLRSDLDGPSIARELGVSRATVRTHTQHIYSKLGVSSRRAAVRRAHQLNLYSRTARA
jgi:LuxR family maltose regulon positive regulatory protein